MKIEYKDATYWGSPRLLCEDEYGNRGEVRFPYRRERGFGSLNVGDRWEDASVDLKTGYDGGADEMGALAEFTLELAHIAKTLDLVFEEDRVLCEAEAERVEAEREQREAARKRAVQARAEELAQYYMQMVRVQREGHSSTAKGELNVTVVNQDGGETTVIKRQMYLRESNGNRWTFNADQVAKFEVKDGSRYERVKLTPMNELERTVSDEDG